MSETEDVIWLSEATQLNLQLVPNSSRAIKTLKYESSVWPETKKKLW